MPKARLLDEETEELMNREMRRLMEREERLQKRDPGKPARRSGTGGTGGPPIVGERRSLWARLFNFFHEVRQELRKVSWPSREQMIAFTTVTLIVTVVLTLIVFGLDIAMKEAVINLLQRT